MRLTPAAAIALVIAVSPGAAQTNRGDQFVAQATAAGPALSSSVSFIYEAV